MKTKIEYEKIDYDFWNLSELKEDFEKGNLYYYSRDCFFKFETLTDLGVAAGIKDTIYKRVETQVSLRDDLDKLSEPGIHFEESCVDDFSGEGWINVCSGTDALVSIRIETIHKLSEIIKRHSEE